jgi:uncharacterized protein with GYD domain
MEETMQTFIMLTRLVPSQLPSPGALEELERKVVDHIRTDCPGIQWVGSYAVFGPCDYLDIFHAPDWDTAAKVSAIVRSYGHANTEIWAAAEWAHFKEVIRDLSATEVAATALGYGRG